LGWRNAREKFLSRGGEPGLTVATYPQLETGAFSQFPIVKRRRTRTVVNMGADGSSAKLPDEGGGSLEWQLQYQGLSDGELATLQQFFISMEGSLNAFTFLDPSANLLARSEELNNSAWQADPMLQLSGGIADPLGGTGGWTLQNNGGGPQRLTQTLNVSAGYTYSFSLYLQAAHVCVVTLLAGNQSLTAAAGPKWKRIAFPASGDLDGDAISFAVELPASAVLNVFGPQVEPQRAASVYKRSTKGGIYWSARFRDDVFRFTSTDVNRHSATLNIYYAEHI
jgi:hypothetical protein